MTSLVVGCPVRQREWVLEIWLEHVIASIPEGLDLSFCFVTSEDDGSVPLLESLDSTIVFVDEPRLSFNRDWGKKSRYHHMTFLRNTLLEEVRNLSPDLFFSLDSDILLHENTVSELMETLYDKEFDAIGAVTYLDRADRLCTNIANRRPNSSTYKRVESPGTHSVDYIMAAKLMKPKAYNIDYTFHRYGEDIGWCDNARKEGLILGVDGRSRCKHIMKPDDLERVDKRVGW